MKMKTQIKRKAKRTLSLLLTAMLIISTMVVGISTVSAATNYYYRGTENSWETTDMTPISGTSLYYYKSKNFSSINKFKISDGTVWESSSNYGGKNVKADSEIKISNLSSDNDNASISSQSSTYYIIFDSSENNMYATFSLPKVDVAKSVTLTSDSDEITLGGEIKFTATISDKVPNTIDAILYDGDTQIAEEKAITSAIVTFSVTPETVGEHAYKVIISNSDYNSVSSSDCKVNVKAVVPTATYYLAGRINQKDGDSDWVASANDSYKFTESETKGLYYYESTYTPKQWSTQVNEHTQYFFVIDSNSTWYGSTDSSIDNDSKILKSSSDVSNLDVIKSTDNRKVLTYIQNSDDSSKVTFWLDTNNGMKLYYTTSSEPTESTESTTVTESTAETTQPVTGDYYFWYSTDNNIEQYSKNWTAVPMTKSGSSYYVSNLSVNTGKNFYFIVNKNADIPYRDTVWKTESDVTVDCTACASKLSAYNKANYHVPTESDPNQKEPVYFYYFSVKSNGSFSFTFDGAKSVTVTEGSIQPTEPTETVTITVPTVDNATVTAVANSTTYKEGESFEIEVGSEFTVNVTGENGYTLNKVTYGTQSATATGSAFKAESGATTFSVTMDEPVPDTVTITVPTVDNATVKVTAGGQEYASGTFDIEVGSTFTVEVTPATGYKFGNISYNNENYNNGESITAVKDATDITVTVAVDTVNVDFTKLNNATIKVSYTDNNAASAEITIAENTTLTIQKGTEFTVTVTPVTDYELKSIAYGTATSSKSPATFTASADGAVTVTVEQTTPVVETVTVKVPSVENASVVVEYTNDKGAKTTTTITDTDAEIVMQKDTGFTVTLNVNSGYKYNSIKMTYASSSKIVNPASFTASTNGTLAITADIQQIVTGEATIKFKSARSYMYKVSMSVNGETATEMTRPDKASTSNDDNFGTSYTGTLTFCWYTQKITVTNGDTTTLNFKTSGTKLNAKISAKLEAGKTYYFAVDDIAPASNTEVTAVELPSGSDMADQMKRNYFHSARHLIYNETTEDGVLGFTNVNNTEYMIGELLNNSNSTDTLSVMSATAVQKSVTYVEEYSDLQNTLLDVNMDGKLDVKDATLIQKAVVGLV